jgi:hypothetical protein
MGRPPLGLLLHNTSLPIPHAIDLQPAMPAKVLMSSFLPAMHSNGNGNGNGDRDDNGDGNGDTKGNGDRVGDGKRC